MEDLLSVEEIYGIFDSFHLHDIQKVSPDRLFNSIEALFPNLEHADAQNFINFVAEEMDFFSACSNSLERMKSLCESLLNSDVFPNRVAAIGALTKIWLRTPPATDITPFIESLISRITDDREIPHMKTMCSECLLQINNARPGLIGVPVERLVEIAKNTPSPTFLPQLAAQIDSVDEGLEGFFRDRQYSMSSFEVAMMGNFEFPSFAAAPSDPLLLHCALQNGKVDSETVLSLINCPYSGFGVQQLLLDGGVDFTYEGNKLFSATDTLDVIAAKSRLLPHTLESLDCFVFDRFEDLEADNPIIDSVFELAVHFGEIDLFGFFDKYFDKTPQFSSRWIDLFDRQTESIKCVLRLFLSERPESLTTQHAFMKDSVGMPIPIAARINPDEHAEKFKRIALLQKGDIAEYVKPKILKQKTVAMADMASRVEIPTLLSVTSRSIITASQTDTVITLTVTPTQQTLEKMYSVTFTLGGGDAFESDGINHVPVLTQECELRFLMKPKMIGDFSLPLICEFTDKTGTTKFFRMNNIQVLAFQLLSSSQVGFEDALKDATEESRIVLQTPLSAICNYAQSTAFAGKNEPGENRLDSVIGTPNGQTAVVIFTGAGQQTVVHLKAPDLEMLSLLDKCVRGYVSLVK